MRNILLLSVLAIPACSPTSEGSSGSDTFVFSSFADPTFTVTVVDENGVPLQGVSVSVEDVWADLDDDSNSGHAVYLSGITNASGVFTGDAKLPNSVTTVDVVLHDDGGRIGPWTDTALQTTLGFYAPSSRQTVTVTETVSLNVTLTEDPL